MKFVFAILAAFVVLEASSFAVPQQQQELEAPNTSQRLERVKRGCSCGPYGCSCTLKKTDDSFLKVYAADENIDEIKRSKRGGCFCGPNGCGCSLKEADDAIQENSNINEQGALKRSKRGGCSCGPHGCSCSLKEAEEETLKRSKRGCYCGPHGCGCTLKEDEHHQEE